MTNKKNLRRVSVVVTAQTLYHLNHLAAMNGWGEKDIGKVIDKLTRGAVAQMSEEEFAGKFSLAIIEWRQRLNMTSKEFADFVGISENTIYNYEKGRCMPQLYTAVQIAERLGTSLDGLMNGS